MITGMQNSLSEAETALAEALAAYDATETALSQARIKNTEARNRLNIAQKAVDRVVDELKKSAPTDSDWGALRRPKGIAVE